MAKTALWNACLGSGLTLFPPILLLKKHLWDLDDWESPETQQDRMVMAEPQKDEREESEPRMRYKMINEWVLKKKQQGKVKRKLVCLDGWEWGVT